ncbi:YcnI family protein [Streptomyces europaeiscabiei]|uniref:YcnI family copper-binding membrane protein n=1 Tax=Streptomyces europaeiscabiei TaxID=146819 RepID=UPI0029B2D544|nr:YcnI family protein [Streptomyces europaeiscabiei]MDX3690511.1 YcnI family protein [Streptomyces europaeiscabiei]
MKASRIAAVGALAGSAVLLLSGPAFAHVSVAAEGTAAKGGYATVNFKVPNERDDATTTKLEINFPTDHPIASAQPEAIPGWKIKVTKAKLDKPVELHGEQIDEAISKITWTAADDGIAAGFFQKFPVSMGQLPENTDELVFKAIQTYSNKEVVRWIEVPKDGEEEPENPAPVLALSAAAEDHHGSSGDSTASDESEDADDAKAASNETAAAPADTSDTTARVLGIVGIVVGAAGVAYGVLAGRRRTTV